MTLISRLMRSGSYGHYWTKQSTQTYWWPTNDIPEIPTIAEDIYFGVHPSKTQKGSKERTQIGDIEIINCLYCDFDLQDFEEQMPLLAAHIRELDPPPSAIVSSGGGYHCYWYLKEPFWLDTNLKREIATTLQKQWVVYVEGDLAVHDLARIMRLPGTLNYKYDPPRPVRIMRDNQHVEYTIEELRDHLPEVDSHRADDVRIPDPIYPNELSEQAIVDLAVESSAGAKFRRLFDGVDNGYQSTSEADLAFCCLLAFWTSGDYHKMDRIFRASGRMRPKWERDDYRQTTLLKALQQTDKHYLDPGGFLTAGLNDDGNANCVVAREKNSIVYTDAMGWLHYQNGHWETELAEQSAIKSIIKTLRARRSAGVEVDDEVVIRIARPSASNVMNAKRLLQPKVSVPLSSFDTSLDELNCANGVLNLKTGELTKHSYKNKFTYVLPVAYDEDAKSSFWVDWLTEASGNIPGIMDFLQLALGYSITGHTMEECLFYIYGPARAGKGIFTETLIQLLGGRPLATEMDISLFMTKAFETSSTNFSLAGLKTARFVAASESRENEWLNAKSIKRWTGKNYITCAHKYGRDFTYQPQFKLWLTSNYPPQLNAEDQAAWARMRILEFPHSYLGSEDKSLKYKMVSEESLRGVLAWIVQGAMKWYALGPGGLVTPKIIEEKTKQAQADVDWVSAWIEEEVQITGSSDDKVPADIYYPEYKDWCDSNGVSPKSVRSLNRALRELGYEVGKVTLIRGASKRCWIGVRLGQWRQNLADMEE